METEYGGEAEDSNESEPQPTNQLPVNSDQLPVNHQQEVRLSTLDWHSPLIYCASSLVEPLESSKVRIWCSPFPVAEYPSYLFINKHPTCLLLSIINAQNRSESKTQDF